VVPLAGLQQGGTRGSSNQGGPETSWEPAKNEALRVNSRRDRGSRSTQGHPDPFEEMEGLTTGLLASEPPRGPLPKGATREDYVGGKKPHKTRRRRKGASGVRNQVI
jgi:hypothetical protein